MAYSIAQLINDLMEPLRFGTGGTVQLRALFAELGWSVELTDAQAEAVRDVLALTDLLTQLGEQVAEWESGGDETGEIVESIILLSQDIFTAVQALQSINASELATLPAPLDDPDNWREMALDLPEFLVATWLETYLPVLYELLHFCGIVTETERDSPLPPKKDVDWSQISGLLNDPVTAIKDVYGWGGALEHEALMENISRLCFAIGFLPKLETLRQELAEDFYGGSAPATVSEIAAPLHEGWVLGGTTHFTAELVLAPVPETPTGDITGMALTTAISGDLSENVPLDEEWSLAIACDADLTNAIGVMVQPDGVSLVNASPEATARFTLSAAPQTPWVLFGSVDSMRLELAGLEAEMEIAASASAAECVLSVRTTGADDGALKLVLNPRDGDGFIADVLGTVDLSVAADLGFTWSSVSGFRFDGGAGFEIIVPLNIEAGPLTVSQVRVALEGDEDGLQFEAAVSGGLDISVVALVVDDIGIRGTVTPQEEGQTGGLLGSLDMQLAFKPPIGLGLVIDAGGVVSGGGYLSFDEDASQYAGVAEIGFMSLGLSAIGILTTRMPDGSDGWSLFLSVFAEFPAIQLGFGFTLNGVGGLVGLHRTLDEDALRERLLSGALDSVMFPEDPVANAPQIISDITAVFPVSEGQFIFGVMAQIGWGTPSLLTINLGVMVEFPDPIRVALLGQVAAILPSPDAAIMELHMDMFGLADFSAGTIALDATIRDSSIIGLITLSGDMAMRANLVDDPTMLMSIGGFNPSFTPPADFPTLRRMKAALSVGDWASVDISCYVAFTSNTFQTGGKVEVWAEFAKFTAEGYIEMDALIQFVPFGFQIHTGFGATIRAGSITLMSVHVSADLSGPSPWVVKGKATFEILKIKTSLDLHISVGQSKSNSVETYDVSALLVEALENSESWSVTEEDGTASYIRLRTRGTDETAAAHPAGQVQVVQNVTPLNVEIERFGAGKISGDHYFTLDSVLMGVEERAPEDDEMVRDWFAPAQFFTMTDKEKVAAPSFEKMDGGVRFGGAGAVAGDSLDLAMEYEEIYIDPSLNQRRAIATPMVALDGEMLGKFTRFGASAQVIGKQPRLSASTVEPAFTISENVFTAVNAATGALSDNPLMTGTYAEVAQQVRKRNATGVYYASGMNVVPEWE